MDETRIIAWIDGELSPAEAAGVAAAVAADPDLSALADRHRRLKARFAAAFGPIVGEAAAPRPSAKVVSLAERRAARSPRRWVVPGAIAASLLSGMLIGHQALAPAGLGDRPGALAVTGAIASALDTQRSGEAGPIRIALSFRDRTGAYCRSFSGRTLSGIACRDGDGWALRYGAASKAQGGDYRMAGTDEAAMVAVDNLIAGDPLDAAGEAAARAKGWR